MTEIDEALRLAETILERPYADPDDDLAMLSRQLIRKTEALEALRRRVSLHGVHAGNNFTANPADPIPGEYPAI